MASTLTMGAWNGNVHTWPTTPSNWGTYEFHLDALGDYYGIEFMWEGTPAMTLFVQVQATEYIHSEGKRPGTFVAKGMGQTLTGTWDTPQDIPAALEKARQWAEGLFEELQYQIENLDGENWEVTYDGYQVSAYYRGPSGDYSGSHMNVTFHDVVEALVEGTESSVSIFFAEGSDYGGHYGISELHQTYSNLEDMSTGLNAALKAHEGWSKQA